MDRMDRMTKMTDAAAARVIFVILLILLIPSCLSQPRPVAMQTGRGGARRADPTGTRSANTSSGYFRSLFTLNRLHITIVVQLDAPGDWNSAGVFEPV